MRLLDTEAEDIQRTVYGITTNEHRVVIGVCLLGSTIDFDAEFLACVSERILRRNPVIPEVGKELEWTLTTIMD